MGKEMKIRKVRCEHEALAKGGMEMVWRESSIGKK